MQFYTLTDVKPGLIWAQAEGRVISDYHKLFSNAQSSRRTFVDFVLKEGADQKLDGVMVSPRTIINFYRRVTNFWLDGLYGKPPLNVPAQVATAFRAASKQRSIGGVGAVIIEDDGTLRSVPAGSYHRVCRREDGVQTGHIISYFWNSGPPNAVNVVPDRVDIIAVGLDGNGTRTTYKFSGVSIGQQVKTTNITVRGVVPFGDGVSDYTDLKPIVDEIERRLYGIQQVMDRHTDPHIQGPHAVDAAANMRSRSESGGAAIGHDTTMDDTFVGDNRLSPTGALYLPRDREDPEYKYLTFDGQLMPQFKEIDLLLDMIHLTTGIPSTAFGISDQSGGRDTGVARERQMLSALQKLRSLRTELSPAIVSVMAALEIPVDAIDWPDAPFGGYAEAVEANIRLVEAAIITPEQAAARLGIDLTEG